METGEEFTLRVQNAILMNLYKREVAQFTGDFATIMYDEAIGGYKVGIHKTDHPDNIFAKTDIVEILLQTLSPLWLGYGFVQIFADILNEDHPGKEPFVIDTEMDAARIRIACYRQALSWRKPKPTGFGKVIEFKRKEA